MAKRKPIKPSSTAAQAQQNALEQFRDLLTPDQWASLEDELSQPLRGAIRLNPLKVHQDAIQDWQARYGWQAKPIPFCPTGRWIDSANVSPARTLEHRMGQYYMQDAASMLPPELFDFSTVSDPLVLDMAASPGGKTTHIGSLIKDKGLIIANDFGVDRLTALRLVLQNWGLVSAAVTRFPGEKFGRWYPETFDVVLLDAPCSMQSLRSTDSHPMRPISSREQSSLSRRQFKMLESALSAVKVGGQIVYSTCTLAPEEDEMVLHALLDAYSMSVRVELSQKFHGNPAPALASYKDLNFHPQIHNAMRLWPHIFGTSGFFAARLVKTAPIIMDFEESPYRSLESVGQLVPDQQDLRRIADFFRSEYSVDLEELLEGQNLTLLRTDTSFFAVPQSYLEHFPGLPCQMLGLKVAAITPGGFEPSHDWISRYYGFVQSGKVQLDESEAALWLQGKDINLPACQPDCPYPIITGAENRYLGIGKIQQGMIKNLLPRRLI